MQNDGMMALQGVLRALSDIFTAGIAITAFALLLYALAFNLFNRVVRSFALILVCVVVAFTAESMGNIAPSPVEQEFWLRVQWVGVVFLPAAYLHFADAVLATTGQPSRGRRRFLSRLAYLISFLFLVSVPLGWLIGPVVSVEGKITHFQPTPLTHIFLIYLITLCGIGISLLVRAMRRSTLSASRRRMFYLVFSSVALVFGVFPFLPYNPDFPLRHPVLFWGLAALVNALVGTLLVIMAYVVAFFGVMLPDRVVKARLFKWLMRGPFTASATLGVVTLIRRGGEALGYNASVLVPIAMVATILILEYLITLLSPLGERVLFAGNDREELDILRRLEERLVTRNDLRQFLEMILTALMDRTQAEGAYLVGLEEGAQFVLSQGKTRFEHLENSLDVPLKLYPEWEKAREARYFIWEGDWLFPLHNGEESPLLGFIGVSGVEEREGSIEPDDTIWMLVDRAAMALRDRKLQERIFSAMEALAPQADLIQRLRTAGQYDRREFIQAEIPEAPEDVATWVREALSHYWGGPKLLNNPLMKYRVVQEALREHNGNQANALRAVLRQAIDQVKPEGERKFTGEWILYNILEMKFVEGRKVRDIAMRLAMSEADLYRKQRVAIEAVAKAILEMEMDAREGTNQKQA
ncbi:histidine kinase N-terminal 7TM domain-containing protein [Anaerolinea thermophila]|uniref:Hypothetical membrane protein n=1 Tax=Anaerolinea thermophila (strain DSM 14523 / JCM 11388 / NBRC 100420 / UNI-1) TaxID=926569 RepID=E8N3K7_ANATU|nr:histidine kinase N-terminal 7TM domain-containing protein [Anaerolinea thermophila]BAJ63021.1 hypothetical membrane protein [Anaerolinea thermophila UNI-1]